MDVITVRLLSTILMQYALYIRDCILYIFMSFITCVNTQGEIAHLSGIDLSYLHSSNNLGCNFGFLYVFDIRYR